MLAAEAINHQTQKLGRRVRKPFLKKSLRVFVDSYIIPAKENMAGEDNPCASIIVKAPAQPHEVIEKIPAIIKLM